MQRAGRRCTARYAPLQHVNSSLSAFTGILLRERAHYLENDQPHPTHTLRSRRARRTNSERMSTVREKSGRQRPRQRPNGGSIYGSLLDRQLEKILFDLAQLLLRVGYGYSRTSALTKLAFVKAAEIQCANSGLRPSIAQIATATGLTRVEVSRIMRSPRSDPSRSSEHLNRATRVAHGWTSDAEFLEAADRPRRLPFRGRYGSFSRLVKKHSGDIPARAMLKEMMRLGMVTRGANDTVALTKRTLTASRNSLSSLQAIAPWIQLVIGPGSEKADEEYSSNHAQVTLYVDSLAQARSIRREIAERQSAFMDGIANLGDPSSRQSRYEIVLSLALASTKPGDRRRRSK